jgi:hypothetical protein
LALDIEIASALTELRSNKPNKLSSFNIDEVKNSLPSYISAKTGYEKCGNERMINNKPLIPAVTKSETE